MEDAEAEAVLLVLGPKLTWGPPWLVNNTVTAWDSQIIGEHPRYGDQWYGIKHKAQTEKAGETFTPSLIRVLEDAFHGPEQKTLLAAKAVCERHHATGKWE